MRLDQYLVHKNLVPSRSRAKDLIVSGDVDLFLNGNFKTVTSPNFMVSLQDPPEIKIKQSSIKFVSRAGLKLEGALEKIQLQVEGFSALDVGISTGGFSDCLLQRGAISVVGVDVGHDQLNAKLSEDPRVESFEGINARELLEINELKRFLNKIDIVVVDVSFISIKYVLPQLGEFLKDKGHLLALVKPQFEVGSQGLNKKGVVKEKELYKEVESEIRKVIENLDFKIIDYFDSSLPGKSGNKEYFLYATKGNN